jgi:hypothetical protein
MLYVRDASRVAAATLHGDKYTLGCCRGRAGAAVGGVGRPLPRTRFSWLASSCRYYRCYPVRADTLRLVLRVAPRGGGWGWGGGAAPQGLGRRAAMACPAPRPTAHGCGQIASAVVSACGLRPPWRSIWSPRQSTGDARPRLTAGYCTPSMTLACTSARVVEGPTRSDRVISPHEP